MTADDLFRQLCRTLNVQPDRHDEAHVECPNCHHRVVRGRTHCSFSPRGIYCFACGWGASLVRFARMVWHGDVLTTAPVPARPKRSATADWRRDPARVLTPFLAALDRVERWQAYKPLSLDAIERWQLGVGVLPASACRHRRLVYPVWQAGQMVALRGRAFEPECIARCPKWLSAGGSETVLFNAEAIRPGSIVIVCENPVDAMLLMQHYPQYVGVASTAGVGTWRDAWTQAIAERRPQQVVIWFDNDLAGQADGWMRDQLVREWEASFRARHPGKPVPPPPPANGPKVKRSLVLARVPAALYRWPAAAPAKADLGWVLMEGAVCA